MDIISAFNIMVNYKSAIEVGKVDEYYSYGPEDIDPEFKKKNKNYKL